MKNLTYILIGLCAGIGLFSALHWAGNLQTSAQRNQSPRWEYCAVTAVYIANNTENQAVISGGANICYLQADGCRVEEVKSELIYSKFLQDFRLENNENAKNLAVRRARDLAFSKTLAKLGAEGWELVAAPTAEFDSYIQNLQGGYAISAGAKDKESDVYFKRLKQ